MSISQNISDNVKMIANNVQRVYAAGYAKGKNEGGGGSVEGYATVTFMNGGEVLFSRMVLKGDDCPDPWVQKRIETPTKESTVQYDYTFNGWAMADGGSADSNALKGITEDKVLYAAFASEVRYYTARLYDGDSLLHTEQVAYGRYPSYIPEKDGFVFNGWLPDEVVTRDIDYTVVWKEKRTLADYTWEELNAMSVDEVRANFKVGETRPIKSGTLTTLEQMFTVTLIGIEHDDLADGSGKAKMSFCVSPMPYVYSVNGITVYRKFSIDSQKGYVDQSSRPLSSSFISARWDAAAVSELDPYVKTVKKKYYGVSSMVSSSIYECDDTYFWLSMSEVGYSVYKDGERYEYFAEKATTNDGATEEVFSSSEYQHTRTPAGTDRNFAVKKGVKPTSTAASKLTFLGGFCI